MRPLLITVGALLAAAAAVWLLSTSRGDDPVEGAPQGEPPQQEPSLGGSIPAEAPAGSSTGRPGEATPPTTVPSEAPSLVLVGRVIDATGRPAANADVTCDVFDPRVMGGRPAARLGTTRSTEDGSWRMELPAVGRTSFHLLARRSGLVSRLETVSTANSAAHDGIQLVLRRGGRLRVRVRDPKDAKAVGGVRVKLTRAVSSGVAPTDEQMTDDHGECVFDGVVGRVLVHVDGGDGNVFGRPASAQSDKETDVIIDYPRDTRLLRLDLAAAEDESLADARVWGQLQVGTHSSGFWMTPGGPPVVRRHGADDDDKVNLTLDFPDGGRIKYTWDSLRQAAPEGRVHLKVDGRTRVELTFLGDGGNRLPDLTLYARSRARPRSIFLRTDAAGVATARLPVGTYDLTLHGRAVAELAIRRDGPSRHQFVLPGYGAVGGTFRDWPGDRAPIAIRFDGGNQRRSDVSPLRDDPATTVYEVPVRGAAWTFVVPWPNGTELNLSLRVAGRLVGSKTPCRVGDRNVALAMMDRLARVTLRPRLGTRHLLGGLKIVRPAPADGKGGGWTGSLRGAQDRIHIVPIDQRGNAQAWLVAPAQYRVEYVDPGAPTRTYSATIEVVSGVSTLDVLLR